MQDVQLFWQLADGSLDDPTLAVRLKEASELSSDRRLALFAVIERALASERADVRAAAISMLHGADGRAGLAAQVRALDDASEEVQRAAVEALRQSVPRCSQRWAHALFHGSPSVRRAALSGEAPLGAPGMEPYLLADPECRPLLLEKLDRLTIESHALPLLVALAERGDLTHAEAAKLLLEIDPRDVLDALANGSEEAFDRFLPLLLGAAPEILESIARGLGPALAGADESVRMRAASAIRRAAARRKLPAPLLGVLAVTHPEALGWPEIGRDDRRTAAIALYDPKKVPRLEREVVRALLLDLVPEPLDLAVAGALLRLLAEKPYALLYECFDRNDVVSAFVAAPLESAPLLSVPDDSRRGRKHLMEQVLTRGALPPGLMNALLAWVSPTDSLDFIERLEPSAAFAMASAMVELERDPRVTLRPKQIDRIAVSLALRLTQERKPALVRKSLTRFWRCLLALTDPAASTLGLVLLGELSRRMETELFADATLALETESLRRALDLLPAASRVAYGKELAIAAALAGHEDPTLRAWSAARIGDPEKPPPLAPAVAPGVRTLFDGEIDAIARASPADFDAVVGRLHGAVQRGLVEALSRRAPAPSVAACVALLGCYDDPGDVARQFERFVEDTPRFLMDLDAEAVACWCGHPELPLLGAAWLWRWEKHGERVGQLLGESPVAALEGALGLPSEILRAHVWRAAGACWAVWAARQKSRLVAIDDAVGDALVALCVRELASDCGDGAAEILLALQRIASPALTRAIPAIEQRLPDVVDEVRQRLRRIVSATGLASRTTAMRRRRELGTEERERIRRSTDLDELARLCADPEIAIVEEAALRLVDLGDAGTSRIAEVALADPPVLRVLLESVALWPDCPALARVRTLFTHGSAETRFRLALALAERGDVGVVELALQALSEPGETGWFGPADLPRLGRHVPEPTLWRRLAITPHPHAYRSALEALIAIAAPEPEDFEAVRAFLGCGTGRLHDLRVLAATWLANRGDSFGFPLLLEHSLTTGTPRLYPTLDRRHIGWTVSAVLVAGTDHEDRVVQVLGTRGIPADDLASAWERLLRDASSLRTLRVVAQRASKASIRRGKLRAVAEVFAWSARMAPVLTGKRLRAHLTEDHALGHTRLDQARIYVSALPVLRGDRHGREIVEGLVLHELGHHRYHAGKVGMDTWKQAEKERIFSLLNLVADEHLERNLRALDDGFGDRLKRLAAWAFQHSDRDLVVSFLLRVLGARAFEVLSKTKLGLGHRSDAVRVDSGALLLEMERAGMSFARFVRALRMGLGDRHGDPKVKEALTLFDKAFKKSDMPRLLEIARELLRLFGWEAQLAGEYGGHESGPGSDRDHAAHGEGIGDDEVQEEVERVIDPTRRPKGSPSSGAPGKLWINVSGTPDFEKLHQIQQLQRDAAEHLLLAAEVRRHASRLRRVLEELGLSRVPTRGRLAGTRVDASRLTALVVRGEPRVLIRREVAIENDLFIGVAVDCSGSMQSGQNIDKARRFAVLLAEAARGLAGVDVRIFGFTDSVLYDAGDAERCAASSLAAGGGNNDAGALLHVAEVAKKSRRSARLLVMVSDGLPTECSTEALRGLAERLERRERMCVAQVAVRPLEEVCFRHYVLLEEDDLDGSVRRFAQTAARLVRRAMRP